MLTTQAWLRANLQHVDRYHRPISQAQLRLLLAHCLQQTTTWLYTHQDHPISPAEQKMLEHGLSQLIDGYPLAYITGQQAFWDLDLKVTADTLIPRPDSETLIETALNLFSDQAPAHILDLGTGSGALALALAQSFPESKVVATDQSKPALLVAQQNAVRNQIRHVEFIQADWFKGLKLTRYDLIVSNPPYIDANDEHLSALKHEPESALVADQGGLGDFQRICDSAGNYLNPRGILMFEHGWKQGKDVHELLKQHGFVEVCTVKDLAGHDRVTHGRKPSEES